MDYRKYLEHHIRNKADITIAVKPVGRKEAGEFGILQTDQHCRISRFVEKPAADQLEALRSPGMPDETPFLASMGIYIFATDILLKILEKNPSDDFGKHIIPAAIDDFKICAYRFDGYWRDIGTIESFFKANLELVRLHPPFPMFLEEAPIYTRARSLPASRLKDCRLSQTLLADGCYIAESRINNTVVGIRTIIRQGADITNCVIMGADYFEQTPLDGLPPIGVGRNCIIKNAIIDKNARICDNVKIINQDNHTEFDCSQYTIREGIVVIPKNSVIPEGTTI
jgi:glucose-1-phosphate adenylyltransferase